MARKSNKKKGIRGRSDRQKKWRTIYLRKVIRC